MYNSLLALVQYLLVVLHGASILLYCLVVLHECHQQTSTGKSARTLHTHTPQHTSAARVPTHYTHIPPSILVLQECPHTSLRLILGIRVFLGSVFYDVRVLFVLVLVVVS